MRLTEIFYSAMLCSQGWRRLSEYQNQGEHNSMKHTIWTGSHREAGERYGALLRAENRVQWEQNFPPERRAFAAACVPVYAREYPAILDELRGAAEGAGVRFDDLAAFLLGMYAFPAGNRCTCFGVRTAEGVLFGRNSDFLTALEPFYENCRYALDGAFAFDGNTTAFSEIEDGVNAHGLAAGLTFIYPTVRRPGWNAGFLVRYLLETCRTVDETLAALGRLTIGSAQTLTLADASGGLAVVECNAEGMAVRRPAPGEDFVAAVNDFYAPEMARYRCDLPDELRSGLRWRTVTRALREGKVHGAAQARALLAGEYGFLCQYDRAQGADTVWSVVYDLTARRLYRCEGNPSREMFGEYPFPGGTYSNSSRNMVR